MEFKHLEEVLNRYGNELVEEYKNGLRNNNSNASGKLANSVRYILEKDHNSYEVQLSLEEYWKYVEYGRKSGKFPPVDKILNWIKVKPVIPQPRNGKVPTEKQLAYLIGRKIAREGIEPKNILQQSRKTVDNEFMESIYNALTEDIEGQVDEALVVLKRL